MNGWMEGCTNGRVGAWKEGRTDGKTNQWMNECTCFKYHQSGMSHTTYFNTTVLFIETKKRDPKWAAWNK